MTDKRQYQEEKVQKSAVLSLCGTYRYQLCRWWDDEGPLVTWVMLNPSTADAYEDDATIRRCLGFTRSWGYAGIRVVNLFAYRATDPKMLRAAPDPMAPLVVVGWVLDDAGKS